QSSADLSKKFGTKKEPNLDTSKGTIYDNITSPVNLYVMEYGDFINFMDKMSAYPWITQNFQKVQMLPKDFINTKDLEDVKTSENITGLKTLKQGGKSKEWSLNDLSLSFTKLQEMM
ncbi:TPA: phage tail protein, partial [Staphylococcus aureus]|nr:phage tail protein [Staphylococcus aureus]